MAQHGFLIESNIQAKNIDTLNKYVTADFDVDGGDLLVLTPPTKKGDDVWVASKPKTGNLGDLWMAYNPSEKYLNVADKTYAGLSLTLDERDYTNIKNKPFTAFKVKKLDEIEIPVYAITDGASLVEGDFIEAVDGSTKMQRVPKGTGATAGSTAYRVDQLWNTTFPQAEIGDEKVAMVHATAVQE